jgi:small subunit ribosomal protein S20
MREASVSIDTRPPDASRRSACPLSSRVGSACLDSGHLGRHIRAPQIFLPWRYRVANNASARKRARQADKRRRHNATLRSMSRTAIKKVQSAISTGDAAAAATAFGTAMPTIDKMVTKGIIHKNKAARHKSRMAAKIKALATAS